MSDEMTQVRPDLFEDLMSVPGCEEYQDTDVMQFLVESYSMMTLNERLVTSEKVLSRGDNPWPMSQGEYIRWIKGLNSRQWLELVCAIEARLPGEVYNEIGHLMADVSI